MKRSGLTRLSRPHRTNQRLAMQMTEIIAEMGRQDAKWGRHRDLLDSHALLEELLPSEADGKRLVERLRRQGQNTWGAIALEEFLEAVDAMPGATRRRELVQLTAVLFQWIDNIDRRELKRLESKQ